MALPPTIDLSMLSELDATRYVWGVLPELQPSSAADEIVSTIGSCDVSEMVSTPSYQEEVEIPSRAQKKPRALTSKSVKVRPVKHVKSQCDMIEQLHAPTCQEVARSQSCKQQQTPKKSHQKPVKVKAVKRVQAQPRKPRLAPAPRTCLESCLHVKNFIKQLVEMKWQACVVCNPKQKRNK
ncbi:uncharacterized protein LOC117646855 [Thrips palmi]|uniref:Uncharacterized protein LOC117646855 n=1 Tax=Thrips palmi TaxID=161013 RepID=A0A6P8YVA9_THRPL|nr:uncharacterized protein LOC117646855 [Thrips palmi]